MQESSQGTGPATEVNLVVVKKRMLKSVLKLVGSIETGSQNKEDKSQDVSNNITKEVEKDKKIEPKEMKEKGKSPK